MSEESTAVATVVDAEIVGSETAVAPGTLGTLMKSELETAITTARRYPRSVKQFLQLAEQLATHDPDTAEACFYKLQRKGRTGTTKIEGPSIRLAEIIVASWGNMRSGARVIAEEKTHIVAQGFAHDLERNQWKVREVRRRITDRNGNRYSEDMITVTANAACSIAERNAIFGAVPRAIWETVFKAAKRVAVGDAKTLVARRDAAMTYFADKLKVTPERIFTALEVKGLEDIGIDELETLQGLKTAIAEGVTTVAEAFPVEGGAEDDANLSAAERLKRDIAAKRQEKKPEPEKTDGLKS